MHFVEIPTEQTTAATDLLLFFAITVLAFLLYRKGRQKDQIKTNIWVAVFMLVAIAAILGAFAHGIKMSEKLHFIIWQPLNLFLGISVGLFGVGVIYDWRRSLFNKKLVVIFILVGIIFYLISLLFPGGFFVFIIYEAVFMLLAFYVYFQLHLKGKLPGSGLITTGIAVTILAAVLQSIPSIQVDLIMIFDHNGIFHITQLLGFFFLFFGLKKSLYQSKAESPAN